MEKVLQDSDEDASSVGLPDNETLDAQFLEDVVAALFPTREKDIPERTAPPSRWTDELSVTGGGEGRWRGHSSD